MVRCFRYTTDIAEDGLIALEKVRKKKYDIILYVAKLKSSPIC